MSITLLGVNHKTCPVEIREKLSFSREKCKDFLIKLKKDPLLEEIALLSTCNRTEFYYFSGKEESKEKLLNYLADEKSINTGEFKKHLYFMRDREAMEHLFSVSSGIDSMILGEGQILGQTKEALEIAREAESVGPNICQLLRIGISCGKRARTETGIGTGASSISFAAIEFAKMLFGSLTGRAAMIIGAGKMGQLTARQLARHNLSQVIVANKTYEKAVEMAETFNGKAIHFDKMEEYLSTVDIVISSTGAPHYVLRYDTVRQALLVRRNKPLFLIDIAVPRDIDPDVNKLHNVYLYDIDDLQKVVENTLGERKEEIAKVRNIIKEEMENYFCWARGREVVPIIQALNKKADEVRSQELEIIFNKKLSHLSETDRSLIDYTTKKIINKLLHKTIVTLKKSSANGRVPASAPELVCELFEIERSGEN